MAKSLEEIRNELTEEVAGIAEIRFYGSSENDSRKLGRAISAYTNKMVERALALFDEAMIDKSRQLELGELADKFFQRLKLNH